MIIGLNGGMGVGKSTAVQFISKLFTQTALVKFAQPLYDMQEAIYDRINPVYARPSTFVKDRKLLQWLGTDWGRDTISQTLWVDLWKAAAAQAISQGDLVICDDVRFDNEAETIKSLGGIIVKITSDYASNRNTAVNGITNHSSEAGINPKFVDFVVANNGTIRDYEKALLEAIKQVRL